MKQVTTSISLVRSERNQLAPNHLWELAARVFRLRADRWKRRALFYQRYRDYFPHVSTSRFVDRCLELDMRCRRLSEILHVMSRQGRLVTARGMIVRRRHGRAGALQTRTAIA